MSSTPDRGSLRWLRGSVVGLVAIGIAVSMHAAAHGSVTIGPLIFAIPIAAMVGVTLANRRYTWWRAFGVLIGLQPVVHLLAGSSPHHLPAGSNTGPTTSMVLAHAGAAVLAAGWLAASDRIIWSWVHEVFVRPRVIHLDQQPAHTQQAFNTAFRRAKPIKMCSVILISPHRGPPRRFAVA